MDKNELWQRLLKLRKTIKAKKIQALLVTDQFNVRYLSDFTGTNGQILLTAKKAYFITDFRYLAVAKNILPPRLELVNMNDGLIKTIQKLIKKNRLQNIHFEEKNISYLRYRIFKKHLKIKFTPSQNLVEYLRMIKSPQEIKLIQKAQQIAEKVFIEVRKKLKIGRTEIEIAQEIERLGRLFGADGTSFPSIVGFNENSASPHHQSGNKKLTKGDIILIDMGMQYKGYCSDMTRMIFTKKPTDFQQKIYQLVLEAQQKSSQKLKAGVHGNTIDECARNIIEKAGYGETFGHSLGHGIGLEVHEGPTLAKSYHKKIPGDTIVTVEPGIYLENSFGVRIEDMLLVKGNHVINLTKIPKKIEDTIFPVS